MIYLRLPTCRDGIFPFPWFQDMLYKPDFTMVLIPLRLINPVTYKLLSTIFYSSKIIGKSNPKRISNQVFIKFICFNR